jgi:hypothetical protein
MYSKGTIARRKMLKTWTKTLKALTLSTAAENRTRLRTMFQIPMY